MIVLVETPTTPWLYSQIPASIKLAVEIQQTHYGRGLFAIKNISAGSIICYYVTEVTDIASDPVGTNYRVRSYGRNGRALKSQYSDLTAKSFMPPIRNKTCWGWLCNESSTGTKPNCFIEAGSVGVKPIGSLMKDTIVSSRSIKRGEQITLYYGKDYPRDYIR